jgi:hypothetical protein
MTIEPERRRRPRLAAAHPVEGRGSGDPGRRPWGFVLHLNAWAAMVLLVTIAVLAAAIFLPDAEPIDRIRSFIQAVSGDQH